MSQAKWFVVCALVLGGVAAAAWFHRGSFMTTYSVVDPDVLFQLLPGSPRRPKDAPHDPEYFDEYGYLVADGTRVTMAVSSKRAGNADNPYDVDLTFRLLITSSDSTATQVFAREWEQTRKFTRSIQMVNAAPARKAHEARIWRTSLEPGSADCVAQVRYGNYVLRFVGRIEKGGYFENEGQFLEMVRVLDEKIPAILERGRV